MTTSDSPSLPPSKHFPRFYGWDGGYFEPECCIIGAEEELDGWPDCGQHSLVWDTTPTDAELPEIAQHCGKVILWPSTEQIKQARFPRYVSSLTRARYLEMPVSLLPALRAEMLPPELMTLGLDFSNPYRDRRVPRWPKDLVLPDLRGLLMPTWGGDWRKLHLPTAAVPNVESLKASIDRPGKLLPVIAEFGNLLDLHLRTCRNHDSLFAVVPTALEHLSIEGTTREFSLSGVTRLTSLRSLELSEFKGEIDCRILAELPNLEELQLSGSRNLTHLEALLECPKLKWLWVYECGRPFKGPLAQQFEARGFIGFSTKNQDVMDLINEYGVTARAKKTCEPKGKATGGSGGGQRLPRESPHKEDLELQPPSRRASLDLFGDGNLPRLVIGDTSGIEEDDRQIDWNALPTTAELREFEREVELAHLAPRPDEIDEPRLPPYLSELKRVSRLTMPVSLLPSLQSDTLPNMRFLSLMFRGYTVDYTDGGKRVPRWPEDLVLPGLLALTALDYDAKFPDLHVQATNVPNLRYLRCGTDRRGKVLETIAELASVRHLVLQNVKNHGALFAAAPVGLEYLHINTTGRQFSIADIPRLTSLRSLALWNATCEIDCRILAELPRLEELSLNGSRKLTHVAALLECPSLRWLDVVACNRPFKGQLAEQFEARGFHDFSTEFS